MPVILEKKLMDRVVGRNAFLANDVCIGAISAYKLSSSRTKLSLYSGYAGVISGLDTMPCAIGDIFCFTKASSLGDGPFPGYVGRVLSINSGDNSFEIEFDMGAVTTWEMITGSFFFCSPAQMGLFGMFGHARLDFYIGDVPSAEDDLDLLTPACSLVSTNTYPAPFDPLNYATYARTVYDPQTGLLGLSGLVAGVATQSGPVSWIRLSTYCRERTSLTTAELVRYSMIVPVADNPGVYLEGDLIEDEGASILNFQIAI